MRRTTEGRRYDRPRTLRCRDPSPDRPAPKRGRLRRAPRHWHGDEGRPPCSRGGRSGGEQHLVSRHHRSPPPRRHPWPPPARPRKIAGWRAGPTTRRRENGDQSGRSRCGELRCRSVIAARRGRARAGPRGACARGAVRCRPVRRARRRSSCRMLDVLAGRGSGAVVAVDAFRYRRRHLSVRVFTAAGLGLPGEEGCAEHHPRCTPDQPGGARRLRPAWY